MGFMLLLNLMSRYHFDEGVFILGILVIKALIPMRKILHFFGPMCGSYLVWCFDCRVRNTKHPLFAAHSHASSMCYLRFSCGDGQLFRLLVTSHPCQGSA